MRKRFIALGMSALLAASAHAADLGITAQAVHEKRTQASTPLLFIDVRDPVEIMFVGFTDDVDVNIPFKTVDRSHWNSDKSVFRMTPNPGFVDAVKAELARRNLPLDTEVITMCRSGSDRGEPSATLLREHGLTNARYVIDGFQGSPAKDGPKAGMRVVSGWQNSGLPWQAKANGDKIYRTDRPN